MDIFEKCFTFRRVDEAKASGLYPYFKAFESEQGPEVLFEGRRVIMIGSNNYLGLTNDPRLKEAAVAAIKKYGTCCTGSRFLNGTLDLHVELEAKIAAWVGKPSALVFGTGFLANLGTVPTVVGRNDIVVTDKEDHASIYDGCRQSFGTQLKYRHNDMTDLGRVLAGAAHSKGALIVTDGVFSMAGDIVNLPALVRLARAHGARTMVDDAHAVGVLGPNGKGTADHFGLTDEVDIIMGTLSKSFASTGAYIASSERVIDYVKHLSRALIFSISVPPVSAAVALKALEIIKAEPERRRRLWEITHFMLRGFKDLGFDTGPSETPIIPIIVGDSTKTFAFAKALLDNGIYANPVIPPAVPPDKGLIRTSYMATHRDEHLENVLDAFRSAGKKLGVI